MLDSRVASAVKGSISVALCVLLIMVGMAQVEARPANIQVYIRPLPRVIIVDDDGPADYHVIQDAIDAARYGDTVLVMPGWYYQYQIRDIPGYGTNIRANIFLKSGVRLLGSGAGVTHIEANAGDISHSGYPVFAYRVNNALVTGFHITGHQSEDPHYQFWGSGVTLIESEVELAHNIIDSYVPPGGCQFFGTCVILDNSSSFVHNNVIFYADDTNVVSKNGDVSRICNNVVHGGEDSDICIVVRNNAHPLIANNIITRARDGIDCALGGTPTIQNNDLVDLWYPYIGCDPSPSDIVADPMFVMPQVGNEFDFHLRPGSPCIDAGTDVGLPYNGNAPDIGAFEFGYAPEYLQLMVEQQEQALTFFAPIL